MSREHHGTGRIDFTPDRHEERSVIRRAHVTAEYASLTPDGQAFPLLFADPDQLRTMASICTQMASRMDQLRLAAWSLETPPADESECPETPPGA